MKNFLPTDYKKNKSLKINHSYLVEQFADYSKIFKEVEKVVKKGDYTLGKAVDICEGNFAKRTGAKYAISVVVEHGGSGSSAAAPIAKKVIQKVLERDSLRVAKLNSTGKSVECLIQNQFNLQ